MNDSTQTGQPEAVGPAQVAEWLAAGNVFVVDVRRHAGSEQIYGAVRYNPRHLLAAERLLLPLPKDGETPIVLYDEKGDGHDLAPLAAKFQQSGFGAVRTLRGGFDAWKAGARRTEELSLEQPIPGVDEQQLER